MRSIKSVVISWTLWGLAYYLYSPYLTVFLKNIVKEDFIGFLYIVSSLVGLIYSIIPLFTKRVKEITIVSLIISGIGLILLSMSNNALSAIISLILYSTYWVSVPIFYLLMNDEVAKIWAISMLPAIIIPFFDDSVVLTLGIRSIFLIAGVIMALTALPLINVDIRGMGGSYDDERSNNLSFIILTILPLSISLPYLYVSMPLKLIPIVYAIGESIGILMALFLSKIRNGLSLALLGFSLISLNTIIPYGAMFYGISEALTALGVDKVRIKDLKDSVKVTILEVLTWLIGYAIATALFILSPLLPSIYASLLAILFALLLLFTIPAIIRINFICIRKGKNIITPRLRVTEGIFPYFKFA
ncbi:hypothetical protein [Sulfurisphaera ohwakuensis]|uniref:MFS family permease n=1 Tax=Sulfurisphaera ohwakuensis TaxID=69656 RepID=A0A650CJJ1_SULOH|nr:hypothetical protein [Sulfurisphaera ohwakuensis]MBB5255024.1 MFS family permease [Sulfurisphaera ohwakuensis]QGR18011.1 hypothetical protein D1869_13065 [Sulfurisphaera ohwakuensis]